MQKKYNLAAARDGAKIAPPLSSALAFDKEGYEIE